MDSEKYTAILLENQRLQNLVDELQAKPPSQSVSSDLESIHSSHPSHYLERELYDRVRVDPAIFDFLQQGSLDGIWYWDLENPDHEWLSPRFWEVLGYDPATKEHLASEWADLINPDDLKVAIANFDAHLLDSKHPYDQVVRYRHANGSTVWVRCRGVAIRNEHGEPVRMLGAHNDLTALKLAEAAASRSARLASIGTLASGIAHQINNPLGAITVAADFALICMDDDELDLQLIKQSLRTTMDEAKRCSKIVRGILQFARNEPSERWSEDLVQVVDHACTIVADYAKESGAEIRFDFGEVERCEVMMNPLEIEQVLVNLIRNACESRPSGVVVKIYMRVASECVEVHIEDNGRGISEDDLGRIFDPFYTTRLDEGGTGLGVSVAHGLVEAHRGELNYTSRVGVGTIATLILPLDK